MRQYSDFAAQTRSSLVHVVCIFSISQRCIVIDYRRPSTMQWHHSFVWKYSGRLVLWERKSCIPYWFQIMHIAIMVNCRHQSVSFASTGQCSIVSDIGTFHHCCISTPNLKALLTPNFPRQDHKKGTLTRPLQYPSFSKTRDSTYD